MYTFGQQLTADEHFHDHLLHEVPIQIYLAKSHTDIGFVDGVTNHFIKVNDIFYNRTLYTFISRPGY